jgi:hypothetical protein
LHKSGAKRYASGALTLADSGLPIFDDFVEMGMAGVNFGAPYRLDPFFGEIGRQADAAIMLRWRGGYFPHWHWVASWFDVDVAAGRHLHRVDERVACFLLAL